MGLVGKKGKSFFVDAQEEMVTSRVPASNLFGAAYWNLTVNEQTAPSKKRLRLALGFSFSLCFSAYSAV